MSNIPQCPTSFSLSSRLGILALPKLRYRRSCILEVASYQPRRQAEACRTIRRCLHCSCQTSRPVSAPCTWEEVERGEDAPRSFTIRNMAKRTENVGDLRADLFKMKRSLRSPMERIASAINAESVNSMRGCAAAQCGKPSAYRQLLLRPSFQGPRRRRIIVAIFDMSPSSI